MWLHCSGSVSPVLFRHLCWFFCLWEQPQGLSPSGVCVWMCVFICVCVCVRQLERSWSTGAPLPRQHFLVINDFFLPLSLSLSLSHSLSLIVGMVEIDDIWAFAFSVTWWQRVEWERKKLRRGGALKREEDRKQLCCFIVDVEM